MEMNMEKELARLITARKANEETFYIYNGVVYAYSKVRRLKHEERFRRICSAENYEDKLRDDIDSGMKVEHIEEGVNGISKISEAKKRANKKWSEKNKERIKYLSDRSRAKSFIRNASTLEDLEEIEKLIAERRKVLELLDILEENEEEEI